MWANLDKNFQLQIVHRNTHCKVQTHPKQVNFPVNCWSLLFDCPEQLRTVQNCCYDRNITSGKKEKKKGLLWNSSKQSKLKNKKKLVLKTTRKWHITDTSALHFAFTSHRWSLWKMHRCRYQTGAALHCPQCFRESLITVITKSSQFPLMPVRLK